MHRRELCVPYSKLFQARQLFCTAYISTGLQSTNRQNNVLVLNWSNVKANINTRQLDLSCTVVACFATQTALTISLAD